MRAGGRAADFERAWVLLGANYAHRARKVSRNRVRARLRRTRCAMGFERQLVAESKTGRELANWNGGLVIVEGIAGASRGERAAGRGNVSRWGRQTSASACRNTSSGR